MTDELRPTRYCSVGLESKRSSMDGLKKNVGQFNEDVLGNEGYVYSTNAQFSSVVANARQTSAIVERIPRSARTIIDIGCGDGVYTQEIKNALPAAQVTGFDPAAEAVKIAAKRFPELQFSVANILDRNTLPSEQFDVGVLRGVLHHVSDPELAIKNSAALCKTLIILEPNGNNPVLKVIEKTSQYHREHEEQSFSSPLLRRWCRNSGWKIQSQAFTGFVPFFCPTPFAKVMLALQPILERIPPIAWFGAGNIVLVCTRD
jgi:ubiquinone/menaquinone biosynthesis C-methylase UbiE